jgi:hypothetical protein
MDRQEIVRAKFSRVSTGQWLPLSADMTHLTKSYALLGLDLDNILR